MAGLGDREDRENRKLKGCPEDSGSRKSKDGRKDRKRTVALSRRMQMLADMVTAGSCVADVGCDHAFLPIYLVQTGKCPKCLAMDVREGPLSGAEEHIVSCGLEEYIETRLSDGLSAYDVGEAQTFVCAGMGGKLMAKILTEGGKKTRSFQELILQPQSEIPEFRIFLRNAGFLITEEDAVYEEGKFYFAMKAVYTGRKTGAGQTQSTERQSRPAGTSLAFGLKLPVENGESGQNELFDLYGEKLLLGKHPVLKQYLLKRQQAVEEIITQLQRKNSIGGENRLKELTLEKEHLERALEKYEEGR